MMTNGKVYAFLATGTALVWAGAYFQDFWIGVVGCFVIWVTVDMNIIKEDKDE